MKIAVTYDMGMVFQHFGHTSQFKIYDIEGSEVLGENIPEFDETEAAVEEPEVVNQDAE